MKSGPDVLKPVTHQCGDHQYNKVTVCFYGLELNPDCVPKSRGLLRDNIAKTFAHWQLLGDSWYLLNTLRSATIERPI